MNRSVVNALLLALLLLPGLASALSGDRNKPIEIRADRVHIDEKRGISTYTGSVTIDQGSLHLEADKVEIYRAAEKLQKIVADGSPVKFSQKTSADGTTIRGQAKHAEYHADTATVYLTGEAHVWQRKDEFSGDHITYDAERSVVKAEGRAGGSGRVHAIIHPKAKPQKDKP